jgi:DNA-binding MarR family transcriptional regulator
MPVDYASLADLRYHIRTFLRVRETAVRTAGLEPQQYLLLLQVKGLQGRRPVTVGALAERLGIRHHSAVELVDRLAARRLVRRRRVAADRRQVLVELRSAGESVLRRLATHSLLELQTGGPALVQVLTRLIRNRGNGPRRMQRSRRPDVNGGMR